MFKAVDQLKAKLDGYRPFNEELSTRIERILIPRRVHYTNSFEDNTLTLEETSLYIETSRMIGGKLEREYREVKGLLEAVGYVENLVHEEKELSAESICKLHAVMTEPIEYADRYQPGQFRTLDSIIIGQDGTRLSFVSQERIPEEVKALLTWYSKNLGKLHPLELAARFHYRLSLIHPFTDGNGRLARLLDDYILERAGYGPLLIQNHSQYFEAYRQPDHQLPPENRTTASETIDLGAFISVLAEGCRNSMTLILDVIEDRDSEVGKELAERLEAFDKTIIGGTTTRADGHELEVKETTKVAIAREISDIMRTKVQSKVVRFLFSGPAKFQQNNHSFSPLIAEVTKRHQYNYHPSETLYEFHLVPDLQAVEKAGMPLEPFMKLFSIAILSHGNSVGMYSAILPFDFGHIYIKQENREEIIMSLDDESLNEVTGDISYENWDINALHDFFYQSLDGYFQMIETDYRKTQSDNK
jgi:fido (protein-threonine AMPylation protein)